MKKLILALIVLVTFASCQEQKMGFVDNGKVINDIQEKKDIESKYDVLNESFKLRADSIGKAYQSEYQILQVQVAKMPQNKQQEAMQPFQAKAQQYQQMMQAEQQKMQTAYQADVDSVISKMKATVKDYGKANGYKFIIGTNESIGTILYGDEALDLSDLIIKEIDSKFKKQ
ncbi:OmpH family outer membrane protein [Lacinutrix jangbogonensis]|uniref:OmpH family outer membrane protein n=1 Tax=Lacinutrix jangbogonensis TaxID=1469557 RepID=UPI00053EF5B9|nr:OmpH family outer membrane protein [Lacinutrix jangbogonensis]